MESLQKYVESNVDTDVKTEEIQNKTKVEINKSDVKVSPEFNNKCNINTSSTGFDSTFMISINFRDVESLVSVFTGEKHENIHLWMEKFESFSSFFYLSEMQKFFF